MSGPALRALQHLPFGGQAFSNWHVFLVQDNTKPSAVWFLFVRLSVVGHQFNFNVILFLTSTFKNYLRKFEFKIGWILTTNDTTNCTVYPLFSLLNHLKNDFITFQSLRLHLKMACFSPKTKYLVHNKRRPRKSANYHIWEPWRVDFWRVVFCQFN